MANHKSAEKRNRQRARRAERNKAVRSALRTTLRRAREALSAGDSKAAAPMVKEAQVALASAASKGVIHRNNAARRKSRIAKALAKLEVAA